jgi:hypothetical protein
MVAPDVEITAAIDALVKTPRPDDLAVLMQEAEELGFDCHDTEGLNYIIGYQRAMLADVHNKLDNLVRAFDSAASRMLDDAGMGEIVPFDLEEVEH